MKPKRRSPGVEWGTCPRCRTDTWLEEEHVIPWWVECLYYDPTGHYIDSETGETDDLMNITMRICRRCNKWLGKKFEDPASQLMKAMIRHEGTDPPTMLLTPADQMTIARWCLKTIILRSFVAEHPVPEDFWEWLRRGGKTHPPPTTNIWIAKYPRQTQKDQIIPDGSLEPVYEPRFAWKAPRFTVGELAMLVFQQREEVDGVFTHPAEDQGFLIRVLPQHRGPVAWPQEKRVGKADIAQIDDALIVP
jgi:hypothetical protein